MFLIRVIFSLELFLVYCYFLVHMCVIIYRIAGNFRGVIFSWTSWFVQNHNFFTHEQGMRMRD